MNNREFDNFIKESFRGIKYGKAASWDRMESMIDQWESESPLVTDEAFDNTVVEKLGSHVVPANRTSWFRLERKMDENAWTAKRVLWSQISGVAIILLLLLLLVQLFPGGKYKMFQKSAVLQTVSKQKEKGTGSLENAHGEIAQESYSKPDPDKELSKMTTPAVIANDRTKGRPTGIKPEKVQGTSQDGNPENQIVNPLAANQAAINIPETNQPAENILVLARRKIQFLTKSKNNIHTGLNRAPYLLLHSTPGVSREKGFGLGLHLSPQWISVHSPFDELLNEPGYDRNLLELGAGIDVHYYLGRFGIYSGMDYQAMHYQPRFYEEFVPAEQAYIRIRQLSYQWWHFPLGLRYAVYRSGKWTVQGTAGINASILASAKYEIEKRSNGLTSLINDLKTNPGYQSAALAKKDFEAGIVEGGKVLSNYILSASSGLGLSYKLNKSWNLYAYTSFQFPVSNASFGPNNDKMQRVYLNLGISYDIYSK